MKFKKLFVELGSVTVLCVLLVYLVWFAPLSSANYQTLAQALAQVGSINRTIIVTTQLAVPDNTTVPKNAHLDMRNGGSFSISTGVVLTINGPFSNPGNVDVFEGAGTAVFASNSTPEVFPDWWTENTTPGTTDMTAAILAAINSGVKNIALLGAIYSYTSITVPDNVHSMNIASRGSLAAILRYANNTGNGFTLGTNFNDCFFRNIHLDTRDGNTLGTALVGDHVNATGVRNLVLDHVHMAGWRSAVDITGGVKIEVLGGNYAGLGSGVAGGFGFRLGKDAASSLNMAEMKGIYVTAYELAIHDRYCTNLNIDSTILGTSGTALKTEAGVTYCKNGYFESNTTAIDTTVGGYVYGDWTLNGTGNAMQISGTHRFGRSGYGFVRVIGYRNAAWSLSSGPTLIPFDAEEDDTEANFSTSTGVFTVPFSGFYRLDANVSFVATADNQAVSLFFYKDNTVIPRTEAVFHSSGARNLGGMLSRLIWLAFGETIDVRATTTDNLVLNKARVDIMSEPW